MEKETGNVGVVYLGIASDQNLDDPIQSEQDITKSSQRGRRLHHFVRQFFYFDEENKKSRCLIDDCGRIIGGNHKGNLERHVFSAHPAHGQLILKDRDSHTSKKRKSDDGSNLTSSVDIKFKKTRKPSKVNLKISEESIIDACVELITVNGRPFSLLEDSGFKKILDPVLEAVAEVSETKPASINRKNIIEHVSRKAFEFKAQISDEIKNKLVSIKIDTVTRLDRQLLGVNIQYTQEGKIVLRNLAIRELFDTHTAENLKKELEDILSEFGLNSTSIYSGTTDNAVNMLKTVDMINKEVKQGIVPHDEDCSHADFNLMSSERCDNETTFNNDSEEEFTFSDPDASLSESPSSQDTPRDGKAAVIGLPCAECTMIKKIYTEIGVHSVRCAAHTLQLAIEDAFKASKKYLPTLMKSRNLCKILRIKTLASELKKSGYNKILSEVVTRWHSLYDMLVSLLKARDGCQIISEKIGTKRIYSRNICKNYKNLSNSEWAEIEELCETLKPARTATKLLQKEQLTIGDFYGAWLDCKYQIKDKKNDFAKQIVQSMNTREEHLLFTPVFAAAIYLDPRYKVLLKDTMIEAAKNHLLGLWFRINPLQNTENGIPEPEVEDDTSGITDPVEILLREAAKTQNIKSKTLPNEQPISLLHISNLIEKVGTWPRISRDTNILKLWESKKNLEPELYRLATVVLGVPMTQVSVERSFSHLRQVLSILRYSLSPQLINDILLIRCNTYFSKEDD